MPEKDAAIIAELFKAIATDWAVCDEADEDSFMVLVNEDRDIHPNLKPPKTLVHELESKGYISLDTEQSDEKDKPRKYMDFFGEKSAIPFVYIYQVTPKGHALAASQTSKEIE